MKHAFILFVFCLVLGCRKAPEKAEASTPPPSESDVVMRQGTNVYRRYRAEGKPNHYGVRDAELWSKDGVSTNDRVYMRSTFWDGTSHFTGVEPGL